jgi:hypothetical protein
MKSIYMFDGTTKKYNGVRHLSDDPELEQVMDFPKHCTEIAPPILYPYESAYFENERWVIKLDASKQAEIAKNALMNQREENIARIPDLIKRIETLEALVLKG